MTPEEQKQQLDEFEARFKAEMERRQEADKAQVIGRTYDLKIDESQRDIAEQLNEKIQSIDLDAIDDRKALEHQKDRERVEFEGWLKAERERMRAEDGRQVQVPQNASPEFVPGFAKVPPFAREVTVTQRAEGFEERESQRNAAAETMRQRFEAYHDQEHARRHEVLNEHEADNRDHLDAEYQLAEVREREAQEREKRDYFEPLPWESDDEAQESGQKAIDRAEQKKRDDRQLNKDKGITDPDKDDPTIKR
jgi:hypothetical protein